VVNPGLELLSWATHDGNRRARRILAPLKEGLSPFR